MGLRTAAALQLLADILQSETQSPIWQDLVAQRRLAETLSADHELRIASGEFTISLEAADTVPAARLERALRQTMLQLRRDGVNPAALADAKRRWLTSNILASDDQLGTATHYGEWLSMGRKVVDVEDEPSVIEAVTLPEVNAVLKSYLVNRCVVTALLSRAAVTPVALSPPVLGPHTKAGVK